MFSRSPLLIFRFQPVRMVECAVPQNKTFINFVRVCDVLMRFVFILRSVLCAY